MIRRPPASSLQKTYDECYLICSTAIYFEGQNNEAEALRAWRNALDQIYYHNAYKIPSSYTPRTETEKALQDSLHAMELQCKERVDLLDALRKSRLEAEEENKTNGYDNGSKSRESLTSINENSPNAAGNKTWLGGDTVPQTRYEDIPRPTRVPERRAVPPRRPSYPSQKSPVEDDSRTNSLRSIASPSLAPPALEKPRTRTPSPEKKAGGMLKTLRANPRDRSSGKMAASLRTRPPPAAAKAATSVWSGSLRPPIQTNGSSSSVLSSSALDRPTASRDSSSQQEIRRASDNPVVRPPSPWDYIQPRASVSSWDESIPKNQPPPYPDYPTLNPTIQQAFPSNDDAIDRTPPPPPPHKTYPSASALAPPNSSDISKHSASNISQMGSKPISYMKEYPNHPPHQKKPPPVPTKGPGRLSDSDGATPKRGSAPTVQPKPVPGIQRKTVGRAAGVVGATLERQKLDAVQSQLQDRKKGDPQVTQGESLSSSPDNAPRKTAKRKPESKNVPLRAITPPTTDDSPDSDDADSSSERNEWDRRVQQIMKKLPKGVDETAAKQIFNEVVIQGDEVHWDDVAGLEIAKSALKETVVYPFLRPDLFMGLREPARGMLLFGPPGTGKTMLARAVATESKSIFFAISASSLTSKFLGESEKLVRALFALAKTLAPSIIFVDEIDSLLGSRGGSSEHEATRRIKTEFLIQWSDLQKAAAGRDTSEIKGDATRVLVLAATNTPWAIDDAARRRFVRRQYIPLPEDWVREKQLRTLLSAQNHSLNDRELKQLVRLTDSFSGSDITALAKDAAMGPLRSLGEKLLHMSPDEIRPINMQDFEASLVNIRPSVSKQGLKEFEDWAREFGERGG